MLNRKMRLTGMLLMSLVFVLVLAACGSNNGNNAANDNNGNTNQNQNQNQEDNKTEELTGTINTAGSSTVYPMMLGLAEWYREEQPKVNVTVDSVGSGGGFSRAIEGRVEFSNASRPIKEEELELAEQNNITLHPIELAYDGLTVAVSAENDFITDLTVDQLKDIFMADSGKTKWSDVNPEWPDETIEIFSPGHDSGTFDYFNEVILEDNPLREDENTTLSEDDNILVRGISNNKYAIGFFGYAYYIQNENVLKAVSINGVAPNMDTIQSGEYSPLSRPLFTYVNADALKKPEVLNFAHYVIDNAGKAAETVGYVALSDEEYQKQKELVDELAGK